MMIINGSIINKAKRIELEKMMNTSVFIEKSELMLININEHILLS